MRTLSALPSVGRDHAFSLFHLDSHRGPIMTFNKIIRISKHPPKADKSAVGAINRPLQMCMDYPHRRVVTVRTSCSNQAVMYSSFHRSLAIRCAGTYPLTMWVIHTPTDVPIILLMTIIGGERDKSAPTRLAVTVAWLQVSAKIER